MRFIALNDFVYKITELDFRKVAGIRLPTIKRIFFDKHRNEKHEKNCDYIEKKYEPIMKLDIILRNE